MSSNIYKSDNCPSKYLFIYYFFVYIYSNQITKHIEMNLQFINAPCCLLLVFIKYIRPYFTIFPYLYKVFIIMNMIYIDF